MFLTSDPVAWAEYKAEFALWEDACIGDGLTELDLSEDFYKDRLKHVDYLDAEN